MWYRDGTMKLSDAAVDNILHVISTFDRERGIPHDYHDLEVVLRNASFVANDSGELEVTEKPVAASTSARIDTTLDDRHEAKEMLLRAARAWLE